jgi:hypothetical protein
MSIIKQQKIIEDLISQCRPHTQNCQHIQAKKATNIEIKFLLFTNSNHIHHGMPL